MPNTAELSEVRPDLDWKGPFVKYLNSKHRSLSLWLYVMPRCLECGQWGLQPVTPVAKLQVKKSIAVRSHMAKFYTAMGDDNPSKLIASPACCLARVSLIVVLLGRR